MAQDAMKGADGKMGESVHREREITNAMIRCQNRIRFEAERLEAMEKKNGELEAYLKGQRVFERAIKEISGENAEIRAHKKEHETVMIRCLHEIAAQITRQNWMMGDMLDFIAAQMHAGVARDGVQKLANAYHTSNRMVSEPYEATK
jgi:hypothetical protein